MKYFSENDLHTNPELIELRGVIISKAISIEEVMDKIILHYFTGTDKEKSAIFFDAVVKELNVFRKQEILKKIWKKLPLGDLDKDYQKVAVSLKSIFEIRNDMAHAQWSMICDDGVSFINRKNPKAESKLVGKFDVEKFNRDYHIVLGALTKLYFDHLYDFER